MKNKEEELEWQVKELPPEIMGEVGKRLRHEVDIEAFRSTCKLWRTLIPSPFPSIFPLKIPNPPPRPYNELDTGSGYYITQHTGYLLWYKDNTKPQSWIETFVELCRTSNITEIQLWLESELCSTSNNNNNNNTKPIFLVSETKPDGNGFFHFRLFTTEAHREYLSYRVNFHEPGPHQLDLHRYRKLVLYEAYYLQYRDATFHSSEQNIGDSACLQKLVLFSYYTDKRSTTTACNRNPRFAVTEKGVGLSAVAVLQNGDLAHLTLNNNNIYNSSLMEWKLVKVDRDLTKFDDIIYYGGRLWGVDFHGGAFVMKDYKSFGMTQIAASPIIFKDGNYYVGNVNNLTPLFSPFYPYRRRKNCENYYKERGIPGRKRLVEDSGTLYMLFPCRRPNYNKTNQIKVYKLVVISEKGSKDDNQYKYEWVEIESIGNKAFFVGRGFSFSMEIGPSSSTGVCFGENPKAKNGNCIFLSGVSFCRSDLLGEQDFPLFEQMLYNIKYTTTGVYSLVDKEFSTISPHDCAPIFRHPFPTPRSPAEEVEFSLEFARGVIARRIHEHYLRYIL